jgi:hypothetical protein
MANDTTTNPWIITTKGLITSDPVRVQKLLWVANAADNDCVVAHANGKTVWPVRAIASGANNESVGQESIEFNPPWPFEGLDVETLDGGTLYVFVHKVF